MVAHRLLLPALLALLVGCPKEPKPQAPKVDPLAEELKRLEEMKQTALSASGSEDPATAAPALVFLELDAQARYSMYRSAHPEEAQASVPSPESLALRAEMGRYLAEMKEQKLHLSPITVELRIEGLSPLGAEIVRIARDTLLPNPDATPQPGVVSGKLDILKLYYTGVAPLDVTRAKPRPPEVVELSRYGVTLCEAILEIYGSKNFSELSGLRQDKKIMAGYKRNVSINKKTFARYAKARK